MTIAVCLATAESLPSLQDSQKKAAKPDLRKLSAAQLKDCLDQPKLCGAGDFYKINDELARRLPQLPTEQLLACFDDWKVCGVGEGQASGWPISDELARRGDPSKILARFWKEPKWTIRNGIEHVAYHFHTPEVTAFMQSVLAEHKEDGEDLYWPVNYLAKKCDPKALQMLSSGRYRNQGCMQYQTSVELFGKCKYRPAIPYLVQTAVRDACLNITAAAEDSLHALYPDAPKQFDTLEAMQQYFGKRARREGFKVQSEL
ncbi:hypothetical protein AYO50_01055 [Acidobacteria bacterium SCGC AG-212-P17]|nr:hypothetical protein AYO50_01055 [Acidobacteria bacterium SCGC AG-212-P17]